MSVDLGECPYLPDRRFSAILAAAPPTPIYRALLDANCRRMGEIIYQPRCEQCAACRQLRVDVGAFTASRSQRRCQKRNADLTVTWSERGSCPERAALLARYQQAVHDDDSGGHPEHLAVAAGIDGGELQARDEQGALVAVSVVDRFVDALSSVYCYYDPEQPRRSLGSFMALAELDYCREHGLSWLYLGFHVADCGKMRYKAAFRPHQILHNKGDDWAWEDGPAT